MTSEPAGSSVIDPARTASELRARLDGLGSELRFWRAATAANDAALFRHYSQIQAIAATFDSAAEQLATELVGSDEGTWILERARSIDRRILDLHRLWGFFRSKLAMRYVPWLQQSLDVADDLAWACYSPVQPFVRTDRRREPPLVYFSGGTSPFLMPRGSQYVVEPLPDGGMRQPDFSEAVRSVPVALIGLPWFQVDHLPDSPLIGHEVGHAVEQDLAIETIVQSLIQSAVPPARRTAWSAWSSEIFADIFGVLACGSGFCRALAALLAGHPRDIAGEAKGPSDWGSYPTRTLRVLLAAKALDHLGVTPIDPSIAERWLQTYDNRPLTEYEADVESVVAVIVDGPYDALGGKSLTTLLSYTTAQEEQASKIARRLLKGLRIDSGDIRDVVSGARLAYDRDRRAYVDRNAGAILLSRISEIPTDGRRDKSAPPSMSSDLRDDRDRLAGRRLATLISAATNDERD